MAWQGDPCRASRVMVVARRTLVTLGDGGDAVNLSYSEEYQQFREKVREFLGENWTPEDVAANPVVNELKRGLGGGTAQTGVEVG